MGVGEGEEICRGGGGIDATAASVYSNSTEQYGKSNNIFGVTMIPEPSRLDPQHKPRFTTTLPVCSPSCHRGNSSPGSTQLGVTEVDNNPITRVFK